MNGITMSSVEPMIDDEDRPAEEEQRIAAYVAAVAPIDHHDVLDVACAQIAANPPPAIVDLIDEQKRHPYDTWRPWAHPDTAQRIAVAVLEAIQQALDDLAGQAAAGGAR